MKINPFRKKLVKFHDGTYGVRKRSLWLGVGFYTMDERTIDGIFYAPENIKYCKGSEKAARAILNRGKYYEVIDE